MAARKMGRRSKYTPEVLAALQHAIELGATYGRAAAIAGISEETLYAWIREKSEFSEVLKRAEAANVERCLKTILKAAEEGTWTAAAWMLERRYPHEYGKTVQEHQGQQKLIVEIVEAVDWRHHDTAEVRDGNHF